MMYTYMYTARSSDLTNVGENFRVAVTDGRIQMQSDRRVTLRTRYNITGAYITYIKY